LFEDFSHFSAYSEHPSQWSTKACITTYKQSLESLEAKALNYTQAMVSFDKLRACKAACSQQSKIKQDMATNQNH